MFPSYIDGVLQVHISTLNFKWMTKIYIDKYVREDNTVLTYDLKCWQDIEL